MHPAPSRPRLRAFTLIELLTVIAIIGILASILVPVVGRVRQTAKKAQCTSNVRQLATASIAYANDNKSLLPQRSFAGEIHAYYYEADFKKQLLPYLGNVNREDILFCPGPLKEVRNPTVNNYGGATPNFGTYGYFVWDKVSATVLADWGVTTPIKKLSLNGLPSRFPLWGCLTYSAGGLNYGHSNPGDTNPFDGQNVSRADGSVLWVKGTKLIVYGTGANAYLGPDPIP